MRRTGIRRHRYVCAIAVFAFFAALSAQTTPISLILEAEEFSGLSGATFTPPTDFGSVNSLGNGDWIRFDSVNFFDGALDTFSIMYWCSYPNDGSNARIRARIDSPTGTVLGTIGPPVPGTGDHMHNPSSRASTTLASATGVHALYITFEGSGNICDLDKVRLAGHITINAADAKTWYVATTGNDANDGSSPGTAFKTIGKAASVMKPGSTCLISQGIYRETVKPLYTGCAGAPITFQPYNGGMVVICGADPITGWTAGGIAGMPSIYKATMNWTLGRYKNQLIADGKMAWMARCPNVDDTYPTGTWDWCGNGFAVRNWEKWQTTTDPIAVPERVCWDCSGSGSTFSASTYGSANQLPPALFGRPANFFAGGLVVLHSFYWQHAGTITGSNSSASGLTVNATNTNLTAPNQGGPGWVSHVLGLLDAPNEWYHDSATSTLYFWAPGGGDPSSHLVEAKRRVLGMDLRGKQYVNVKNLHFLATSMTLGNANNCIIDGCKFKYVAHNDVPPSYEMGTTFEIHQDCGDGHLGVYISGKNNLFENCSVIGSSASGIVIGGAYNTITNCRVSACDYAVTYHAGILVQKRYYNDPADAVGLDISRNSLSFNCRANLQVGSAATPSTAQDRLKIQYNDFGAACYTTTETGSIAAQSSYEVEVSHNWFHDVAFPGVGSIVMESDFGARGWIVHHNVFWQGKGGPVEGFRRGFDWTFTWDDPYGKCFNNTVVDSTDRLHWDWEYLNNGTPYPGLVANIIFAKDDTARWKFTNPVNRDYSLRTGSPAIDAGVTVPGFVETFEGTAPDLGAYEFGQPRWVAGANWQDAAWTYPPSTQSVGRFPVAGNRMQTALRLAVAPGRLLIYSQPRTAGTIAVFGVTGRRIAATPLQLSGCTAVDVRSVPGAICFVKCMLPGETFVWKIVKE